MLILYIYAVCLFVVFVENESKMLVSHYFIKSISCSFGSICMGSMLVALVKTSRAILRFLVDKMRPRNGSSCSGGLTCPMLQSTSIMYPAVVVAGQCSSSLQLLCLRCLEFLLAFVEKSLDYFNRYAFCYIGIYEMNFIEASK